MTPLQPITNPLAGFNPMQQEHLRLIASQLPQWYYESMRGKRYKTGGHYVEDKSYQRHEIPLGELARFNPRLLK